MDSHFFTNRRYIKARILSLFDPWNSYNNRTEKTSPKLNIDGQSGIVVRELKYKTKNFDYELIHNEASALKLLNELASVSRIRFPKLISFDEKPHWVRSTREYVFGQSLSDS
jgi:hypothetical protein